VTVSSLALAGGGKQGARLSPASTRPKTRWGSCHCPAAPARGRGWPAARPAQSAARARFDPGECRADLDGWRSARTIGRSLSGDSRVALFCRLELRGNFSQLESQSKNSQLAAQQVPGQAGNSHACAPRASRSAGEWPRTHPGTSEGEFHPNFRLTVSHVGEAKQFNGESAQGLREKAPGRS